LSEKFRLYCLVKSGSVRIMKKLAIAAMISVAIFGLAACDSGDSEVVVEMDQGNITKEQFYEELKADNGETVLHNLVYSAILEDRYDVSEDAVDEQVEQIKGQFGESFDLVLLQSGFSSEEEFRESFRLNMLEEEALTEDIEVSDEEIEARYNRYLKEIQASHILVNNEELANELYDEIEGGADFATLAEEHSDDPGSAQSGGDLGYFSAERMVIEFEDAAYNLDINEVSEPVQSEHGWHIIKVTDIRDNEAEVASLEEMRPRLRRQIALPQVDEQHAMEKMQQLLEDANITVNIEEFEDLFIFEDIPSMDEFDFE